MELENLITDSLINQYEHRLNELNQEKFDLTSKNDYFQKEITILRENLLESEMKRQEQTQELFQSSQENLKLKRKIEEIEIKANEYNENNKKLLNSLDLSILENKQKTQINGQQISLIQELEEKKSSLSILKKTLENYELSLQKQKENEKSLQINFQSQIHIEQKLRCESQIKLSQIQGINEKLENEIIFLKESQKNLEEKLFEKEKELIDMNSIFSQEKLQKIQEDLEIKGKLEYLNKSSEEQTLEINNLQTQIRNLINDFNEKENIYEEKLRLFEKDKKDIENQLEEKKQENTKLYLQYQSENKMRFRKNNFSLPFEQEYEDKNLKEFEEMRLNYSKMKDENIRLKTENEFIKDEINKKLPLIELRKKEYDQMISNYKILKNKLELSLLNNTKLQESNKTITQTLETLRQETAISHQAISFLQNQQKIILFINEKLKDIIYKKDPFFNLMNFSDFNHLIIEEDENELIENIINWQNKNYRNILELSRFRVENKNLVSKNEFIDIQNKFELNKIDIKNKDLEIENLKIQIQKLQSLEKIKNLLNNKEKKNFDDQFEKQMIAINSKKDILTENYENLLKENEKLKSELKTIQIQAQQDAYKLDTGLKQKQIFEERLKNLEISLSKKIDELFIKEKEINESRSKCRQQQEQIIIIGAETQNLKLKLSQNEKKIEFLENSKSKFESVVFNALKEKEKYFEAFSNSQKEISTLLINHHTSLQKVADENSRLQSEILKINNSAESTSLEKVQFKLRLENYQLSLQQLEKQNLLNLQIISEQNDKLKELSKLLSQNIEKSRFLEDENLFSGFIRLEDQKPLNLEELQETINAQKLTYDEIIENLSNRILELEQENTLSKQESESFKQNSEFLEDKLAILQNKLHEMTLEQKNSLPQPEFDALNKEKTYLIGQLNLKESQKNEIEKEKKNLEKQLENLSKKNNELDEKNFEINNLLKELNSQLNIQSEIVKFKDSLIFQEKELFKNQYSEIEKQINDIKKENEKLLKDLENKNQLKEHLDEEIKNSGIDIELEDQDEISILKQKISLLELQKTEAEMELFNSKNQIMKFMGEINENSDLENKDNKEENLKDLNQKINEIEIEKNNFKEKILFLENRIKEIESSKNELLLEKIKISQELNTNINELNKIKELIDSNKLISLLEKSKKIIEIKANS